MAEESDVLAGADPARMAAFIREAQHVGNSEVLQRRAMRGRLDGVYELTQLYFARSYFSTQQAVALDALRGAIDEQWPEMVSASWRRCSTRDMLMASWLCAASAVCNSPGHTGQFLHGRTGASVRRIQRAWRMDVFAQFEKAFKCLEALNARESRVGNRVCQGEAFHAVSKLRITKEPSETLFYADPPYTKDHYSRLYHVLETLYRYDYPDSVGVGRMRSDRFLSDFSYKSRARASICALAAAVARRGAHLLLSYPSGGLVPIDHIIDDLRQIGHVSDRAIAHRHSSLGGRHGPATKTATEYLILLQPA